MQNDNDLYLFNSVGDLDKRCLDKGFKIVVYYYTFIL